MERCHIQHVAARWRLWLYTRNSLLNSVIDCRESRVEQDRDQTCDKHNYGHLKWMCDVQSLETSDFMRIVTCERRILCASSDVIFGFCAHRHT